MVAFEKYGKMFDAMEFMDWLVEGYETLSDTQRQQLDELPWFHDHLEQVEQTVQRRAAPLTADDLIDMLCQACPSERPCNVTRFVVRAPAGNRVMFEPSKALESLAATWYSKDGPSQEACKKLEALPWGARWKEIAVTRPDAVRRSRKFPRHARITLLEIYYPIDPPSWKDEIPVTLEDGVWVFKPVTWLDDVSNVWLGGKLSVSLTKEEKERMEKLPWVLPWIEKLRSKRESRLAKRPHDDSADAASSQDTELLEEVYYEEEE